MKLYIFVRSKFTNWIKIHSGGACDFIVKYNDQKRGISRNILNDDTPDELKMILFSCLASMAYDDLLNLKNVNLSLGKTMLISLYIMK